MTAHKALCPKDETDRLYGKRGLASVQVCVHTSILGLRDKTVKSKKRLITAVNNNISNISTDRRTTKTRRQKWKEKQLYGYFKRQTSDIAHDFAISTDWKIRAIDLI